MKRDFVQSYINIEEVFIISPPQIGLYHQRILIAQECKIIPDRVNLACNHGYRRMLCFTYHHVWPSFPTFTFLVTT